MNRMQTVKLHWGRWAPAALLACASVPLFYLPVLRGGDVITWPSTLAADIMLAAAVLLVMQDARRRTFAWMAALSLPVFLLAAVVHNVEYALTGVEEPSFLLVAILGGPTMLLAGAAGLIWTAFRDRRAPRSGGGGAPAHIR